ncbi:MAG: hypothetical protein U0237_12210 [Thermoleophilia bacterium]
MKLSRRTALTAALSVAIAAAGITGVAMAGPGGDRNHDRLPDRWEKANGLSLKLNQAGRDQDHDGLRNLTEFRAGTNPKDADTDDDGVRDAQEDRDHDGLSNRDEQRSGTRADRADSDHDGTDDGDEHSRNEVSGTVTSFDQASGALVLQPASGDPVTVTVDGDTRFEDGTAADLVAGATVGELKFVPDGKGGNIALKVEFKGDSESGDDQGDDHGGRTRTTTTPATTTAPAA